MYVYIYIYIYIYMYFDQLVLTDGVETADRPHICICICIYIYIYTYLFIYNRCSRPWPAAATSPTTRAPTAAERCRTRPRATRTRPSTEARRWNN